MMYAIYLAWDLNSFLNNFGKAAQDWGKYIVFAIGTFMVIAAAFFIGKGLMSQGRGQTNWALTILLLIIGGALMAGSYGGWNTLVDIAEGSKKTIDDLGGGGGTTTSTTILPFLFRWL
jgi:hypothetical protein